MNFKKSAVASLLMSVLSTQVYADDIALNVQIVGEGKIIAGGESQSCTESCTLNLASSESLAVTYENVSGHKFSHWGVESCDQGEGAFISEKVTTLFVQNARAKEIEVADFNGDGVADTATISLFPSELEIRFGGSDGELSFSQQETELTYTSSMEKIDWDNDGDIDLIVIDYASNKLHFYTNDGLGEFSLNKSLTIDGARPYTLASADINGDGYNDLLLSNFDADITAPNLRDIVATISKPNLTWYVNNGNDEFTAHQKIATDAAFFALEVADSNGDGNLEIIGSAINKNSVMLFTKSGQSYSSKILQEINHPYGVAFGDIDANGRLDVLTTSYYEQSVTLLAQDKLGGFSVSHSYTGGDGFTSAGFIDANQDGKLDIIWGEFDNRRISVMNNTSYKTCVLDATSNRTIEATFTKEQSSGGSQPDILPVKEKSSGGGAILFLTALLTLVGFERKFS